MEASSCNALDRDLISDHLLRGFQALLHGALTSCLSVSPATSALEPALSFCACLQRLSCLPTAHWSLHFHSVPAYSIVLPANSALEPAHSSCACLQHMFSDDAFSKIKKGARIVNVARGGVIDDAALGRALDAGQVAQVRTCSLHISSCIHWQAACWGHSGAAASSGCSQPGIAASSCCSQSCCCWGWPQQAWP